MKKVLGLLVGLLVAVVLYVNFGFYSIQPIGVIPSGATALVWRQGKEPFFNSPDAMCLLVQNSVSLMCRMAAMGAAPTGRILFRLPYQRWAYSFSVDGSEFDK